MPDDLAPVDEFHRPDLRKGWTADIRSAFLRKLSDGYGNTFITDAKILNSARNQPADMSRRPSRELLALLPPVEKPLPGLGEPYVV